jgi:NAD(P)H-dependent FMN reductase
MPNLAVIIASTRPGRVGPLIASWFLDQAAEFAEFTVDVLDLGEIALPFLDEPEHPSSGVYHHQHTRDWSASVAAADAFVFVMPEYNFAMTAPLKNAIDYLYHEWAYKPVGFVSYGMTSGGLRAVQMVKQVVTTLNMFPVTEAVTVHLRDRVGVDGVLHASKVMEASARDMLRELGRLTHALTPLREHVGDHA